MTNNATSTTEFSYNTREECPGCRGKNSKVLFKERFSDASTFEFLNFYYGGLIDKKNLGSGFYELVRCNACDLIYQKHILDHHALNILYDKIIDPEQSLNKRELAPPSYFRNLYNDAKIISELINKEKARDIKVLDFGMGWGHWALTAKALGYNVVGAELSENRIKFCQSLGLSIIDPLQHPQPNFDFIHTEQVFEHLDKPLEILSALTQCLKPNGIIKIFVPNRRIDYRNLTSDSYKPNKDAFHPLEHINAYNFHSICKMADRCNLKPLEINAIYKNPISVLKQKLRHYLGVPSWYFRKS